MLTPLQAPAKRESVEEVTPLLPGGLGQRGALPSATPQPCPATAGPPRGAARPAPGPLTRRRGLRGSQGAGRSSPRAPQLHRLIEGTPLAAARGGSVERGAVTVCRCHQPWPGSQMPALRPRASVQHAAGAPAGVLGSLSRWDESFVGKDSIKHFIYLGTLPRV